MKSRIPTICFIAPGSGYGKTELIEGVIINLSRKLKICALKHSRHNFEPDKDKDTWRFRKAGAAASAIITEGDLATFFVPDTSPEGAIKFLGKLNPDLILCEGFKNSALPKILILKVEKEFRVLPSLEAVLAVVFDGQAPSWVKIPILKKDPKIVTGFVLNYYKKAKGR
jgi:molybdopterin-guanine dinucleotide biosynthesis protein MobB